jgi:VWFA-related protein
MYHSRQLKFLSPVLTVVFFLLFAQQALARPVDDADIRADLPLNGSLRVENARGHVHVEVWGEKFVAVAATVRGQKPKGVPVSIKRTDELLTISVSPQEVGMLTRVDLTLRIPERSRAEIIATAGGIDIEGVPAKLSAQTVSGDIRARFSESSGAQIRVDAPNGNFSFWLCAPASANDKVSIENGSAYIHDCRMGAGDKPVNFRTVRGHISVTPPTTSANETATSETRKLPVLIGSDKNSPGAGTPSTPLNGPEEVSEGDVVRVDTQLVTLNVSVIDRGTNRGLKGLAQSDFKLFEDGTQQQIAHFEAASAPFNLILLIDLSTSTEGKIGLIRDAALRFVNAARPMDRIGIITFANKFEVVSPPTTDREQLRARINEIQQPKGSTKLYDALAFALDEATKNAKDSRRNAIILMSDGLDSTLPNVSGEGSKISYDEVLSRVREFDGVLYSLWLDTTYEPLSDLDIQDETFDLAYDRMKELADAGGGVFYEVEKLEDLADAYERVVADLGTVYSLSYRPTNKDRNGKWRAIRVSVARQNAVARGKRGYYAN